MNRNRLQRAGKCNSKCLNCQHFSPEEGETLQAKKICLLFLANQLCQIVLKLVVS